MITLGNSNEMTALHQQLQSIELHMEMTRDKDSAHYKELLRMKETVEREIANEDQGH